jgi:hypothetical protein
MLGDAPRADIAIQTPNGFGWTFLRILDLS